MPFLWLLSSLQFQPQAGTHCLCSKYKILVEPDWPPLDQMPILCLVSTLYNQASSLAGLGAFLPKDVVPKGREGSIYDYFKN